MTEEKDKDITADEAEEVTLEANEESAEEVKEESKEKETGDSKEETAEEKAQKEIDSLKDKLMRHAAEFDNYKKRTQKEREELYATAVCDTIEKILPIKDNLERALTSLEGADEKVIEGIKMIDRQFGEVLKAAGVEEIKCVGEVFDPQRHNAVMHEEAEDAEENTVTEEFMKGYIYKNDKVIRHSMVKVAN